MSKQKRNRILATKETILKNKKSIDLLQPCPGVYILINKNEIVYVGKSDDILLRLRHHLKDPNKIFTHYYIIKTNFKTKKSNWLEGEFIMKFKPRYNSVLPSLPFIKLQKINKELGVNNLWDIKKCIRENNIKTYQFGGNSYLHISNIPNFHNLLGGRI